MTDVVLLCLLAAAFLYCLFFVVRSAVEQGVRRAVREDLLSPPFDPERLTRE